MTRALAAGAEAIEPVLTVEDALSRAAEPGAVVLAGERRGVLIDGFDLGNSPDEFTAQAVRGRRVVMTTTNGTRALLGCSRAGLVLAGALVNASAVVEKLAETTGPVHLICAGTDGFPSLDDELTAGALVDRLLKARPELVPDTAAKDRREAWLRASATPETLLAAMRSSSGGSNLVEIGAGADIELACRVDTVPVVGKYEPGTGLIRVC